MRRCGDEAIAFACGIKLNPRLLIHMQDPLPWLKFITASASVICSKALSATLDKREPQMTEDLMTRGGKNDCAIKIDKSGEGREFFPPTF